MPAPQFPSDPVIVDKPSDNYTKIAQISWLSNIAATSEIFLMTGPGGKNPVLQQSFPEGTSFEFDKLLNNGESVKMQIILTANQQSTMYPLTVS